MHSRILLMPIKRFLIRRLNPYTIEPLIDFLLALFLSFSHGLNCFSLLVHLIKEHFQAERQFLIIARFLRESRQMSLQNGTLAEFWFLRWINIIWSTLCLEPRIFLLLHRLLFQFFFHQRCLLLNFIWSRHLGCGQRLLV